MAVGVYSWSTTANSNGAADANINYAEGQSPASLNNSARAQMAALRGWFDALGGNITYGGAADAYTATHNAVAAWSAYAAGQVIMLVPGATNTGASTLNVDGLGTKAICKGASTAVAAGDIVQNVPVLLRYDGTRFQIIGGASAQYQPKDDTLTALAALSYTSGTLVITMTAADTFALTASPVLSAPQVTTLEIGHASDTTLSRVSAGVAAIEGQTILTGANPQVTTLELGHASDTTLARAAAGQPTVEGVYFRLAGKTAIPIPASAMVPNTTNGPSSGTTETTTNKVMYRTLDFDQTTEEAAQFQIIMPKSWNESTVTFQPIWTAASGSGGVLWAMQARAFSDDDALDAAFGVGQTSTDTLLATGDCHVGPESSAITIAGSPAEGDLVIFRVYRYPADAGDTLAADAKLLGVRLFITTNAANDA